MSQPIDEQLRQTFDALAERVRTSVSEQASSAAQQLIAAVEAARVASVEAAVREAGLAVERDVTARLNESFTHREEQIREAARVEWFEAGLAQARAEEKKVQDARAAEAQLAAMSAADALAEAQAAVRAAEAASARAAAEAEADRAAALAVSAAVHRDGLQQLVQAVRALDATTSLSQTLDALAAAARRSAERSATFLVRGDTLRAWSHTGFDLMTGPPVFEVPLDQAGVPAAAVRSSTAERAGAGSPERPAFAGVASQGTVVAVPLAMNGQVIAVLCGEQPAVDDDGESLAFIFEVLARHAARVLESLTALRLAQLGTASGLAAPSPSQ